MSFSHFSFLIHLFGPYTLFVSIFPNMFKQCVQHGQSTLGSNPSPQSAVSTTNFEWLRRLHKLDGIVPVKELLCNVSMPIQNTNI